MQFIKNIYNKLTILFLIFLILFNISIIYADDIETEEPSIENSSNTIETSTSNTNSNNISNLNTRSCIVLDRLSKKILYGKNETSKIKMASTTKIMTAIIIIENFDLNTIVEVSKKAASTGGSRLGLKTGDKITINDLLYGLMLCSGNDAAVCLAESTCGSISSFCELMNQKAKELNLTNTNFESPHGLDSDAHYTTAYELALLTDYALQNKTFSKIVGTKTSTISINGNTKNIHNTNELLGNLNGIYGVKTGFTNGANRCLVTACKREQIDIICIVLGCDTKKFRTQDSIKLIEWTYKNYEYINIEEKIQSSLDTWKSNHTNPFIIEKGQQQSLDITFKKPENPIIPILKSDLKNIQINLNISTNLKAPISPKDKIGYITISARKQTNIRM